MNQEQKLLNKLILEPDTFLTASELVKEQYFLDPLNKTIYATIKNLWSDNIKIDLSSLKTADNSLKMDYLKVIVSDYVSDNIVNVCEGLKNYYNHYVLKALGQNLSSDLSIDKKKEAISDPPGSKGKILVVVI